MIITSTQQLKDIITSFYHVKSGRKIIAVDTETTSLDPHTAKPLLLSFAWKQEDVVRSYVVDVLILGTSVFEIFRRVLEDPTALKVMHNATYDWKIFYHQGIECKNVFCTMIGEQALYPVDDKSIKFDLKSVANRRLNIELDKSVRETFTSEEINTDTIFSYEQLNYAEMDAYHLISIFYQQVEDIKNRGIVDTVKIDQSNISAAALAEYIGVQVDQEELMAIKPELDDLIASIDHAIQVYLFPYMSCALVSNRGVEVINTSSPLQIKTALNLIGCDVDKSNIDDLQKWEMRNKKRKRSTKLPEFPMDLIKNERAVHALTHYDSLDHYILRAFAVLNAARTLLRTFVVGLNEQFNSVTKRVHPSYLILGAKATGRYSSRDPNFQNIPQDGKLRNLGITRSIRNCFKAGKDRSFLIFDFSGIELVILAALSQDQKLLDQILKGDIHLYVTHNVLKYTNITPENKKKEPHKPWRDASKTLSYGIAYGVSGPSVAEQMNQRLAPYGFHATPEDGNAMIEGWYNLFPDTKAYLEAQARNAITAGVVKSSMGRRREWNTDFDTKWKMLAAQREGMNSSIQGTGADMFKIAVKLVYEKLYEKYAHKNAAMVMFVHDELVVECDNNIVDNVYKIMKQCMEESIRITLPILSEYIGKYEGTSVEGSISDKYDK
jgi:DNA polymerase-1